MIKIKKGIISVAILSILLTTAQILPVDAKVFENETTINQEVANTFDPVKVKEIIGKDRYDTAIKISKEGFKEMVSSVILVNATSLPDALCVAPLANAYECPILLINKDNIPNEVYEEINRLGAQDIILIGGEGVISAKVEEELESKGYYTDRIGGKDRYETSLNIASALNEINPVKEISIVNGVKGLADATSIAPPSARDGRAILYTNGNDISGIESFITKDIEKAYIVGKEAAVSPNVENILKSKNLDVKRLGGDNRNDTNAKVISEFYSGKELNNIYVAKDGTGKESDLIDALSVGPLAAKTKSPVIIATGNDNIYTLSEAQEDFVENHRPKEFTRIGGGDNEIPFDELKRLLRDTIELFDTIEYSDGSIIEFENCYDYYAYDVEDFIDIGANGWINITHKDKNESIIWESKIKDEFFTDLGEDIGDVYVTHLEDVYDLNDGNFIVAYSSYDIHTEFNHEAKLVKYNKEGDELWKTPISFGDFGYSPIDVSIESNGDNLMVKSTGYFDYFDVCYVEIIINKDGKILDQKVWDEDGNIIYNLNL